MEEVGRLLITQNQEDFRATDTELYKSIPKHLEKLWVLDHWYHKDFTVGPSKIMPEEDIVDTYEQNRSLGALQHMTLANFSAAIRAQEERTGTYERHQWNEARPSSYQTWQQLAKVLATGDVNYYKPTSKPNTQWSNWPESGSL